MNAARVTLRTACLSLLLAVGCGNNAPDATSSPGSGSTGSPTATGGTTGGPQGPLTSGGIGPTGATVSGSSSATTTLGVTGSQASNVSVSGVTSTSAGVTATSAGESTTGQIDMATATSSSGMGGSSATGTTGGTSDTTSTTSAETSTQGSETTTTGSSTTGGGGGSGCAGETSGISASKIYYVTPTGAGDGTSFSSAMNLTNALAQVAAGEMILLQPGTYSIAYTEGAKNTINLTKSGQSGSPINVVAANCGRALIDFSFPEQAWVQDSYGFFLTGSYWYFKGIGITRAGYQGVYVTGQYNTFENCAFYENRNTGLEINEGGAYTTVINCDAYKNYDPKKFGGMADGFGPKQTQGPGNRLIGCRAWENSDDGFDAFDSPEQVIIENSWAFRNGVDVWNYGGFAGNGNGFKLGGNAVVAHNKITNSVAFGNVVKGFDQNNNAGGITILNCTAYGNGTNYGMGNPVSSGEQHTLRNNISVDGPQSIANADASNNSWDTGPAASAADFVSVDLTLATAARNIDGSLPDNGLFRLALGSNLIDKGVNVGLPYSGSAPDLGAFERE